MFLAPQPPVNLESPCIPSPCGANAVCKESNGAGSCSCLADYIGNPYEGCRPECVIDSDCPSYQSCSRSKCRDPCPGACGQNADCIPINHSPSCTCRPAFTGDPFTYCTPLSTNRKSYSAIIYHNPSHVYLHDFFTAIDSDRPREPCNPSPCGPNSQCRVNNGQPVCTCLPNYIGSPPGCRPECVASSECPSQLACINQKCENPCPAPCGLNTKCVVVNHSPICSCMSGYSGDPFTRCTLIPPRKHFSLYLMFIAFYRIALMI